MTAGTLVIECRRRKFINFYKKIYFVPHGEQSLLLLEIKLGKYCIWKLSLLAVRRGTYQYRSFCGQITGSFNLSKPNDIYIYIYIYVVIYMSYRSANSRRYILSIYSTNIHTEYFKHAA